jgi:hypothetical protein
MIVVHIDTLAKRYPSGKTFEIAGGLPGLLGRIDTTSNAYALAGTAAVTIAVVVAVGVAAVLALTVCPTAIPQLINPTIQILQIISLYPAENLTPHSL